MCNEESWSVINPDCSGTACRWIHCRGAAAGERSADRLSIATGEPTAANPDPNAGAFRRAVPDLGYIEGKNILIEFRYAEGKTDRFPQ